MRHQPELEEALFEVGERLVGDAKTEDLLSDAPGAELRDLDDLTDREKADMDDMAAGQLARGLEDVDARLPDWREAFHRRSTSRQVEYVRLTPEQLKVALNVVDRLKRVGFTVVLEHEFAPDTEVRIARRPVLVCEKTWQPPGLRLLTARQFNVNYRTRGDPDG